MTKTGYLDKRLAENQQIIEAYPYHYMIVDEVPETGERGVLAFEPDEDDDDQLVYSKTLALGLTLPDAERLAHSWNELPRVNAALRKVLERHNSQRSWEGTTCIECIDEWGNRKLYPCPTVKAIEEAMSGAGN